MSVPMRSGFRADGLRPVSSSMAAPVTIRTNTKCYSIKNNWYKSTFSQTTHFLLPNLYKFSFLLSIFPSDNWKFELNFRKALLLLSIRTYKKSKKNAIIMNFVKILSKSVKEKFSHVTHIETLFVYMYVRQHPRKRTVSTISFFLLSLSFFLIFPPPPYPLSPFLHLPSERSAGFS